MADEKPPLQIQPNAVVSAAASAPERAPSIYDLVRDHLASKPQPNMDPDKTIIEHIESRGLPILQQEVLVLRFRAQGMTRVSKVSDDVFNRALHEALYARI